jgi:Protein of unknown function (DUF2752)
MTATLPAVRETRTRRQRLQGPTLLAGGVLGASLLLHLRDPHQGGSYTYCPWLLLTGTYCPGCGGLRAVNDLTNGDLAAAASSNLLFVASLPVLVLWWASTVRDRWQGRVRHVAARRHGTLAVAFLAVALVFAVVRNLPFGAWLAP